MALMPATAAALMAMAPDSEKKLRNGVTIEARFAAGEYPVPILSAKQATCLETWLKENKYRIPEGEVACENPVYDRSGGLPGLPTPKRGK